MPNGDHLAISNRDDYIIKFLNNKANTESGYTLKELEDSIMLRKNLAERAKNSSNLSMHSAPWASPAPFEN